jgi:1-acyl-sn-glycerol-3-phosphate acyltransferase
MENFITLLHSGLLYYVAKTITINRKKEGRDIILKKIIESLKNKKSIVLFPEGDTNRKKKLLRGKSGIAELTLKTGVPVIPFGIKKTKNNFKRIIEIGKPLYFLEEQKLLKKIENNQEKHYMLLRTVTNKIMKEISKLSQKHYYDN